jgi:hypothetical protein
MAKKIAADESRMTSAERQELAKLVRFRAKLAKDDANNRGKALLAQAEAQLAARFKADDAAWAEMVEEAERQIDKTNAVIQQACEQRGIPKAFRPRLESDWWDRGENTFRHRRAELRLVAQTQVAALVADAKVEIDREAERQLTQLASTALLTDEARQFLGAMPKVETLMLPLKSLKLEDGEVVKLIAG